MEKTKHEGWNCVPELKEAIESVKAIDCYKYEILNCVRESELRDIVSEMTIQLQEAIDTLNTIDVEQEFETVYN